MLKIAHFVIALPLLLALAAPASARPHASFSHGFSSHASPVHASSVHLAAPPAAPAAPSRSGFGSFGSRPASQQSDSALSRQLGRQSSEAAALRTLDASRAAQATPRPAPGYAQSQSQSAYPQPAAAPGAPTTVIVHQDGSGIGHVIAGAMIARSLNGHAGAGYYPPPSASYNAAGGGAHGGISFFGLFLSLCLLAALGWGIWFALKRVRRRAANREADKPNYSFERN